MNTTHIISTNQDRPVAEIIKDIEAKGIIITQVLSTGSIFVHVPKELDARCLKYIAGIRSASPNYEVRARL
jgi:hypothetical protein